MEIPLSKLLAGNVSLEILWQRTLSHISLAVISLQKFLGKKLSLQIFVGRSFSSKFGWTGITVLRFSVRISLQRFSGNDFSSNIFRYILPLQSFCLNNVFLPSCICERFFFRISLQNCFCTKHLSEQKPFRLDAFYTRHLLHQTPSAPNTFYSRDVLYSSAFYTKRILHQTPCAPSACYTRQVLHQNPFTPDTF